MYVYGCVCVCLNKNVKWKHDFEREGTFAAKSSLRAGLEPSRAATPPSATSPPCCALQECNLRSSHVHTHTRQKTPPTFRRNGCRCSPPILLFFSVFLFTFGTQTPVQANTRVYGYCFCCLAATALRYFVMCCRFIFKSRSH